MKNLHTIALKGFITIIVFSSLAFSLVKLSSDLPWKNGFLDGELSIQMNKTLFKVSGRTLEGKYKNNQKIGTWKLWSKDHKLLQERVYKNNFEYNVVKKDKEVETKYPLKRNAEGMYAFPNIQEKDVLYAQRIWKKIPVEYIQNNSMISFIFGHIDFSQFQAYTDDNLKSKDSTNQVKSLNFDEQISIRIMGDWYYDSKRKISNFQVLAISPVIEQDDREFWYFYPEMRKSLLKIEAESENTLIYNLDDKFFFGDFPTYIYKVENIEGVDFKADEIQTKTQETIENQLQIEAALWLK